MTSVPASRDPRLSSRSAAVQPFKVMGVIARMWELRAMGRHVVDMAAGQPDWGTPKAVSHEASAAAANASVLYTPAPGIPALRHAIANMYGERYDVEVDPARVFVTTGASAALLLAAAVTVDRDDEILLADPGYPCNSSFVALGEGRVRTVPVEAKTNYQLTASHISGLWHAGSKGTLVATPANPTGTVVEPDELTRIVDATSERGGVSFIDEIYGELVYDRVPSTILAHTDETFVVNSFSKTFGMTGWRLGYLVCPPWAIDALDGMAGNLYICAPAVSQEAGLACLTTEVWAEVERRRWAFKARRDLLVDGLRGIGFEVPVIPQGAFYVYARIPSSHRHMGAEAFCADVLDRVAVGFAPGTDFGTYRAEEHVRFSYTCAESDLAEGVRRIGEYLGS